ncbi:MAG: hypothetical protein LBC37_06525 [Zoogloeaceae bacterium]|jgi:predicted Zn finger-like uncharacterized protein|nr:hypothetical protein [Zoogloeaceae bacterium]
MARIAHLKTQCPNCAKWTDIYVVEDGSASAKVKCERCKKNFDFGAGMMYDPIGYVSEIPLRSRVEANPTDDITFMAKLQRPGDLSHATKGKAVGLWFAGIFGFLQLHNFYLRKNRLAILRLAVLVVFVIVSALTKDASSRLLLAYPLSAIFALLTAWNCSDLANIFDMEKSEFGGGSAEASTAGTQHPQGGPAQRESDLAGTYAVEKAALLLFEELAIDTYVEDLLSIYAKSPEGFIMRSAASQPVRTIGEKLNEAGGFDLMIKAHHRFASRNPLMARNLEMCWNGIGGWAKAKVKASRRTRPRP